MDHGPESKRRRLSNNWTGGPPPSTLPSPHHSAPPHPSPGPSIHPTSSSGAYQPSNPSSVPLLRNSDHHPPPPHRPPPPAAIPSGLSGPPGPPGFSGPPGLPPPQLSHLQQPHHQAPSATTASPYPHAPPPPPPLLPPPHPAQQQHPHPHPHQQQHHHQPVPFDDRRYHEQDAYGPRPDSRSAIPPSPMRPPYSSYSSRDQPGIKRSPTEEHMPFLTRRPQSTPAHQDGLPAPHLGPHPPPAHHQHQAPPLLAEDPRRTHSYEQPPQSNMYERHPSYPPPTPVGQNAPYEPHHQGHPGMYERGPGPEIFQIHSSSSSKTKKASRASQACESCRSLKAKCDEQKPCKNCKDKNVECKYREAQPKQVDRVYTDMVEAMQTLADNMQRGFDGLQMWKTDIERAVQQVNPNFHSRTVDSSDEDDIKTIPASRHASLDEAMPLTGQPGRPEPSALGNTMHQSHAEGHLFSLDVDPSAHDGRDHDDLDSDLVVPPGVNDDSESEKPPGLPVNPADATLEYNHTTKASHLLTWSPIEALCGDDARRLGITSVNEFPVRLEEKRGLLRVYGRGEGLEARLTARDTDQYGPVDAIPDDNSEPASPPSDCWGGIGSMSPTSWSAGGKEGVSRRLDFSEEEVWKYVRSYEDNMQNMHPILLPRELELMVRQFLGAQTARRTTGRSAHPNAAPLPPTSAPAQDVASSNNGSNNGNNSNSNSNNNNKRKRSLEPEDGDPESASNGSWRPQRSIRNAIVLLVLALGKICLVKHEKLPNVVNDPEERGPRGSPHVRNGALGPSYQSSPPAPSQSSGLPSPAEWPDRPDPSRRTSQHAGGPTAHAKSTRRKNYDVIPGLDYFAVATDIIGNQLGGHTLPHVYAGILSGLYYGQLARAVESYAAIHRACETLHSVLRPHMERLSTMKATGGVPDDKLDNELCIAFWTCLQLESDLIAELSLHGSLLLSYESLIPFPDVSYCSLKLGLNDNVMMSYLGQLWLRRNCLNPVHKEFYSPNKPSPADTYPPSPRAVELVAQFEHDLNIQTSMPMPYKFSAGDPPAEDLLLARMRAKWWGANVIIFRPFVKQVLEINFKRLREGVPHEDLAQSTHIDPRLLAWAIKGVHALKESTQAFHGHAKQNKRFIITNPFGTAHAQWGNLLALAAAYRDPSLQPYISHDQLAGLFDKTTAFLRLVAQPGSALAIDYKLLESIRDKLRLGPGLGMEHRANASFSSTASSGGHHAPPTPHHMGYGLPVPSPGPITAVRQHGGFAAPPQAGWDTRVLPPPQSRYI